MLPKILDKIQNKILIFVIVILYSAIIGLLTGGIAFVAAKLTMPELSKLQRVLAIPFFTFFFILIGIYNAIIYLKKRK